MFAIPSGFSFSCFPAEPTVALQHERIDARTERITLTTTAELHGIERFGVRLPFCADAPQSWKTCAESFHFIPNIKQSPENFAGAHVFRNRAVESIAADGFVFDAERSLLLRI